MTVKAQLFVTHPVTNQVYNVKEAAKIIGITPASLYGRLRKGDTNDRLWRPNDYQHPEFGALSKRTKEECTEILNQIPKTTKFDLLK